MLAFAGARLQGHLRRPRPAVLRRGAAPGRHPGRRLRRDRPDAGLHPRPAVRDRGRVREPDDRLAVRRRRLHRAVRPARGDALRVRLHDGREGRHRLRRRARLDAHLRRDRRARGARPRLARLPVRDAPAGHVAGAAVRLHRRDLVRLRRLLHRGGAADRRGLARRLLPDLLAVPEPGRPHLQRHQGHDDGDVHRDRRLLLRLHAGGGPVGVGKATAQSMVVNILGIHAIGMLGTQLFWGGNPRAPIGG